MLYNFVIDVVVGRKPITIMHLVLSSQPAITVGILRAKHRTEETGIRKFEQAMQLLAPLRMTTANFFDMFVWSIR